MAQQWRELVPLETSRGNVEKLLGAYQISDLGYRVADGNLLVIYSLGRCSGTGNAGWNVARDTVVSYTFYPKRKWKFRRLKLDWTKVQRIGSEDTPSISAFINKVDGVLYEVDGGYVRSVEYFPPERLNSLRCRE